MKKSKKSKKSNRKRGSMNAAFAPAHARKESKSGPNSGYQPYGGVVGPVKLSSMSVAPYSSLSSRTIRTSNFSLNGKQGLRMTGCYPIGFIQAAGAVAAGTGAFFPITGGGPFYGAGMNPFIVFAGNSLENRTCANWTRFRFRKLRLRVETISGTNQLRSCLISYYGDGAAVSSAPPSYLDALHLPGSYGTATWRPSAVSDVTPYLDTEDWYYVDLDGTSVDSSTRQCIQGIVLAYWLSATTAATTDMIYWMDYEIDLLEARQYVDLALSGDRKRFAPDIHSAFVNPRRKSADPPEPLQAPDEFVENLEGIPSRRESVRLSAASERSSSTDRKDRRK